MAALAEREQVMTLLAIIAASVVLAWVLIDYIPPLKWRTYIRRLFLAGGVYLYMVTLYVSYNATL